MKLHRIDVIMACGVAIVAMAMVDYHLGVLQSPMAMLGSWFCPQLSPIEKFDASQTAREAIWPARLVVVVLTWVGFIAVTYGKYAYATRFRWLAGVVALCAIADGITTSRVFCVHGIQDEVHPAVRLCAYSYGRIAGVILAKSVQCAGVVAIGMILPRRINVAVLIAAALLYLWAAYTNISFLMNIVD